MFAFWRSLPRRRSATRVDVLLFGWMCLKAATCPPRISILLPTRHRVISPCLDVGGNNIQQQGSGSLTSNYSGTVAADIDFAANSIDIKSTGTVLDASVTGNWKPNVGGGSGMLRRITVGRW